MNQSANATRNKSLQPPDGQILDPNGVVAIASSAGGLDALGIVLSGLTTSFPYAVIVVQHLDWRRTSLVSAILRRRTRLAVNDAGGGESPHAACVYLAPANHHLVVDSSGRLQLTDAGLVNFVRPSADVLFKSVAEYFEKSAIGVVLSGTGKDGAEGIAAIKQHGGMVVVQDESSAKFFGMPAAAIATGAVDFIVPLAEISELLLTLV